MILDDSRAIYAHLAESKTSSLHPLTPRHVPGVYEKGRWARANKVLIKHCPYTTNSDTFQEWCIGWLAEDEEIIAAVPVSDIDFEDWR